MRKKQHEASEQTSININRTATQYIKQNNNREQNTYNTTIQINKKEQRIKRATTNNN